MTDTHAFRNVPRKNFTDQQRAKIFLDRGGKCHKCARKLTVGDDWILEHVTALQNGGDNADRNMAVTCVWCLPGKNKEDAGKAAKGRAVATSLIVPNKHRKKSKLQRPPGTKFNWSKGKYEKVEQ